MPRHEEMKGHCNSYGFLGALCAIAAGVSWSLTRSKGEYCYRIWYESLQWYHVIGILAGIAVCLCAAFALATILDNITPVLLYIAGAAIAACGLVMGYSAYHLFNRPCLPHRGYVPIDRGIFWTRNNIFNAEDGPMIAVFVLDILACILFLAAAANIARRAIQ